MADFVAGETPTAIARPRADGDGYETLLLPASEIREFIDSYGFVPVTALRTETAERRFRPTTVEAVRAAGPRAAPAQTGSQTYATFATEQPVPPLRGTDDQTHLVVVGPVSAWDDFLRPIEEELEGFVQVLDPVYAEELGARCYPRFERVPCLDPQKSYALYCSEEDAWSLLELSTARARRARPLSDIFL